MEEEKVKLIHKARGGDLRAKTHLIHSVFHAYQLYFRKIHINVNYQSPLLDTLRHYSIKQKYEHKCILHTLSFEFSPLKQSKQILTMLNSEYYLDKMKVNSKKIMRMYVFLYPSLKKLWRRAMKMQSFSFIILTPIALIVLSDQELIETDVKDS